MTKKTPTERVLLVATGDPCSEETTVAEGEWGVTVHILTHWEGAWFNYLQSCEQYQYLPEGILD